MMIFECLWLIAARITYWLLRPVIWFLTARDCERCQYYYYGIGCNKYCHKNMGDMEHCKARPWRPHFERYKRAKKRKFFDI